MSPLPDRKRPRLTQPAARLAASLVRMAGHGTWRVLHPATRGRFLDAPRPAPLERLYYEAGDGWRAPLLRLRPCPGGSGEPVLLAHGLGASAESLRYGSGGTLATTLSAAGFDVFLWAHRADADAIPPSAGARSRVDFDAILERDLPAAAERAIGATEFERLHFVGHGLGGQLGLCWGASDPALLAAVVAVGAPVRFTATSASRRAARALALLPERWRLPLRAGARLVAPLLDDGDLQEALGTGRSSGPRVRGALTYTSEDLPVGLLRQVLGWHEAGVLCSAGGALDWTEAFRGATAPLLAVVGEQDHQCPPEDARCALDSWGGEAELHSVPDLGHRDLVFSGEAEASVFRPIAEWLVTRRKRSWVDASSVGATLDAFEEVPWQQAASGSRRTS